MKFEPSKEIRQLPDANSLVYFFYAYIFFERKNYPKAVEFLDKGLKLNPLDTRFLFEKAEVFKVMKDWPSFKKLTDDCIEYAYSASDLARAYRNYGYMFVEKEDYDAANAAYVFSLFWFNDKTALAELFHISQKTGKVIDNEYYQSHAPEILKDRSVPIGPNKEILRVIYTIAERMFQEDKMSEALFYYQLLYDFVKSVDIHSKIQVIQGNLKGTA